MQMSRTTSQIEAQLAEASSHLTVLEQTINNGAASKQHDAAMQLYQRAKLAQDQLEKLEIGRALMPLFQSRDDIEAAVDSPVENISRATRTCIHLASLLSRNVGAEFNTSSTWNSVNEWYTNLHHSTTQSALILFRKWMKQSSFPDEGGCNILKRVFAADGNLKQEKNSPQDEQLMSDHQLQEWRTVSKCVIELQITRDALMMSHKMRQQQHAPPLPVKWRFDILDEICRPIAHRLRYHFLDETAILSQDGNNSSNNESVERLPEWLFRYLCEVTDRVVHVVNELQSFIQSLTGSILVRLNNNQYGDENGALYLSLGRAIQTLQPYYLQSLPYYLREIVRMARHALRSKSYFSHPGVVGSDAYDGVAQRAIEQLFLFDDFISKKLGGFGKEQDFGVLKLVDVFLASNESLFRWWLEGERDNALAMLKECADRTLSSYQTHKNDDINADSSRSKLIMKPNEEPPLFPPIAELFVSIIHSSFTKSNSFSKPNSRKQYISNVMFSISSDYLDMVHAEATSLRQRLIARKNFNRIPSDSFLTINVMDWIGIINGVNMALSIVNMCNNIKNEVLERIAISFERMRDAMVEDFTSDFVENIVMERAKFASYMMRCPFLLSQSTFEDHLPSSLQLSIDLYDAYHTISVALQACHKSLIVVDSMKQSQPINGDKTFEGSTHRMLSYGAISIEDSLSTSICQKLLDVAIDPQGMIPEIHLAGAQQFRCDAMSIVNLFSTSAKNRGIGPLERVAAASHLMSLASMHLEQLRDTLFDLSSGRIGSMFARDTGSGNTVGRRLEVESFYSDERLVMEAESMLGAKGFYALVLEEALSIINRRM